MCGSMADIQSVMAEIRRGKKRRRKIGQKYNVHICYAGQPSKLLLSFMWPKMAA